MPNRMIREDMLHSERVQKMPVEARWFFASILLTADDVGLFEASHFRLARAASIDESHVQPLLQTLCDRDLVRLYRAGDRDLGFVPRFRQRVQIKRSKYPLPPDKLIADDDDALSKIKHLRGLQPCAADVEPGDTGAQQPEPNLTKPNKVSVSSTKIPRRRKAADQAPCPFDPIIQTYHEVLPEWPQVKVLRATGERRNKIKSLWEWVMTTTKSDGQRRATTESEGLVWMRGYFTRARANEFLMGRATGKIAGNPGHEHWEPSLDFLCTEKGLTMVVEKTRESA